MQVLLMKNCRPVISKNSIKNCFMIRPTMWNIFMYVTVYTIVLKCYWLSVNHIKVKLFPLLPQMNY